MKRILSALLVLSMLICSFLFVTTDAASERGEMLMRTTDLDTSWKSAEANKAIKVIGSTDEKIDTLIRDKTPNSQAASTHTGQNSMATAGTLWMLNTNTWAFGYVIEIDGLAEGETVTASVSTSSWAHDHEGVQGGGWINEGSGVTAKYTLGGNGVYTL
ncbi:MAG: hypothetical protein IJ519_00385, partial [Clostridia bacterium]|nr:hypothetical protein [Clostridia bacterium]